MILNANERSALIGQVVALRNVVDGILASLEENHDAPEVPASACEHPPEQRKYGGAMGTAVFECSACGAKGIPEESPDLITSRLVRPNQE